MSQAILLSVQENLLALSQGRDLLAHLEAALYARRSAVCFNSSVGGHMRHVLDHYHSLLGGLELGRVDYEARARDAATESDPSHAARQVDLISENLSGLSEDRPLAVRSESAGPEVSWAGTSLLRELDFALSHTVHHFALIAVIATEAGLSLPEGFGVAPSTLRHRATLRA